jgi:hypothetical protein
MPRPRKDPALRMDRDLRIPVTAEQKALVFAAATSDGMDLAAWVRPVILRLAQEKLAESEKRNRRAG